MVIKKLMLKNYRNYDDLDISFSDRLNIIIGDNAQGKTNILEAIYVLAVTKSYLGVNDKNLIKIGNKFSLIKAVIDKEDSLKNLEIVINDNGKKINSVVFKNLFYNHHILRPCCYKCPYKDIMHPGDITIGDYWGIDRAVPGFNDNKGVSLVLINNEKGQRLFNTIKDRLIYQDAKIEDSLQPPLKSPFDKPENRECFWNDLNEKPFKYIAKKYGDCSLKSSVRRKLGKLKRKLKKRSK